MLRRSASTTAQALAFSRRAISKIVRKALPFPGMPWYGVQVHTNTVVSVETLVYSLRQNMLVWGGQSTMTNPGSVDRLVHDTAQKVTKELERLGLLGSPKP